MANKKQKKIKIDIILPNFNSSDYIKDTIKSILRQTYKNWNLIIVDDCSDKKTKNILKKITKNKKIKVFWLKKNKGAGFCRNYALKNQDLLTLLLLTQTIYGRRKVRVSTKIYGAK